MKTIFIILLFYLPFISNADSLFVDFSNDTVFICDYNAWAQCGFELDYEIVIDDSIITVTEIDTAFDMTTCYGYHNFEIPITNLQEGYYRVDIYRDDLYEDVRFIDSFRFQYLISQIVDKSVVPNKYIFFDPYPNPFNPSTIISFYIPIPGSIDIKLFDITGRKIKTLLKSNLPTGFHELNIDGTDLSSGIYFVVLASKNSILSKKIVLVK